MQKLISISHTMDIIFKPYNHPLLSRINHLNDNRERVIEESEEEEEE
jgi:hypothetical protein